MTLNYFFPNFVYCGHKNMEITGSQIKINKQKRYFYAYEFVGTAVLTLGYNLN